MDHQGKWPPHQVPVPLEEMEVAAREVEALKAAFGDDGENSSYLGLRGVRDRDVLVKLLLAGMQQLDRLREKEIVLLKNAAAGLTEPCQSSLSPGRAAASGENDATVVVIRGFPFAQDGDVSY